MGKKPSLLLAMPVGLGICHPDVAAYMYQLGAALAGSQLFDRLAFAYQRSSRIVLNRNCFAKQAIEEGYDLLFMIDPDMRPDMYVEKRPGALPFFETAFQFWRENPCTVIAAPACGERPEQIVNVFVPQEDKDNPNKIRRMTHAEAAERVRDPLIEHVAAIGTGLIMIDTNVFKYLEPPYFFDTYSDKTMTHLLTSQDVNFTLSCTDRGINVMANWYAYCGHHKDELLGCPGLDALDAAHAESAGQCNTIDRGEKFVVPQDEKPKATSRRDGVPDPSGAAERVSGCQDGFAGSGREAKKCARPAEPVLLWPTGRE